VIRDRPLLEWNAYWTQRKVEPVSWRPDCLSFGSSRCNKRPRYAPEFRRQMIELQRAGRLPAELADEFDPTAQSIHKWVAQDGPQLRFRFGFVEE